MYACISAVLELDLDGRRHGKATPRLALELESADVVGRCSDPCVVFSIVYNAEGASVLEGIQKKHLFNGAQGD